MMEVDVSTRASEAAFAKPARSAVLLVTVGRLRGHLRPQVWEPEGESR